MSADVCVYWEEGCDPCGQLAYAVVGAQRMGACRDHLLPTLDMLRADSPRQVLVVVERAPGASTVTVQRDDGSQSEYEGVDERTTDQVVELLEVARLRDRRRRAS